MRHGGRLLGVPLGHVEGPGPERQRQLRPAAPTRGRRCVCLARSHPSPHVQQGLFHEMRYLALQKK